MIGKPVPMIILLIKNEGIKFNKLKLVILWVRFIIWSTWNDKSNGLLSIQQYLNNVIC